jgi:hypothetical protein
MEAEEREEEKERMVSGGNTAGNSGDEDAGSDIVV